LGGVWGVGGGFGWGGEGGVWEGPPSRLNQGEHGEKRKNIYRKKNNNGGVKEDSDLERLLLNVREEGNQKSDQLSEGASAHRRT